MGSVLKSIVLSYILSNNGIDVVSNGVRNGS